MKLPYYQQDALIIGVIELPDLIGIFVFLVFYDNPIILYLLPVFFEPIQPWLDFIDTFGLLYNAANACKGGLRIPLTVFYLKNLFIKFSQCGYAT